MNGQPFQKFAGAAAVLVGLSSLAYGLIFLFLIPAVQKPIGSADSLVSFSANPIGRQIASLLLALGGLAASAAIVGIYQRLRELNTVWALWSFVVGIAYSVLTTLHGVYLLFLFPVLSGTFVSGDAATKASTVVAAKIPSPLDPSGFSKFFLSGIWLLITGMLMLRSRIFPRPLAYLTLVTGIGVLLLFIGSATGTTSLILATGVPGSAVLGPIFWLWVGYTLWTTSSLGTRLSLSSNAESAAM